MLDSSHGLSPDGLLCLMILLLLFIVHKGLISDDRVFTEQVVFVVPLLEEVDGETVLHVRDVIWRDDA